VVAFCNTSTMFQEYPLSEGVPANVAACTRRDDVGQTVPKVPVNAVKANGVVGGPAVVTRGLPEREEFLVRQRERDAPLGSFGLVVVETPCWLLAPTSIACGVFPSDVLRKGFPLGTNLTDTPGDATYYGQALLVGVFPGARDCAVEPHLLLQPFRPNLVLESGEYLPTSTTDKGYWVATFVDGQGRRILQKAFICEHTLPSWVAGCGSDTPCDEVVVGVSVLHCVAQGTARNDVLEGVPNGVVNTVQPNLVDVTPAVVARKSPEPHKLVERQLESVAPLFREALTLLELGSGCLSSTGAAKGRTPFVWKRVQGEVLITGFAKPLYQPSFKCDLQFEEILSPTRPSTEDTHLSSVNRPKDVVAGLDTGFVTTSAAKSDLVVVFVPRKKSTIFFDLSVSHSHTSPLPTSLYNLV